MSVVRVEHDGGVAWLILDRPEKRNALNQAVRSAVVEALGKLENDPSNGVVILTGAGDQAFAAGADVADLAERSVAEQREAMSAKNVYAAVAEFPKPIIALINGLALGGGCELALACDIRIASESARLGQPEIHLGLIPGGGATQRLPRLVGPGHAMRLVLSGETVDAAEALRIGLVDLVFPADEVRVRTLDLAQRIATHSPLALGQAKAAIQASTELPLSAGLAREAEGFLACFGSRDGAEGVAAFLRKGAATSTGS